MGATTSRIGEVKLHLRVPGALESEVPRLRQLVEREVLVGVLESLERRLHAVFGATALIRIRRLSLHWRLEADVAASSATIEPLAEELARELLAEVATQSQAEQLRPRSGAMVVFRNTWHADAARLADAADGLEAAWFHAEAAPPTTIWEEAAAAGVDELGELLQWLARMQRVEGALALAPAHVLAVVVAAAPVHGGVVALIEARRSMRAATGLVPEATSADGDGGETAPSVETRKAAEDCEATARDTMSLVGLGASPDVAPSSRASGDEVPPEVDEPLGARQRQHVVVGEPTAPGVTVPVLAGDAFRSLPVTAGLTPSNESVETVAPWTSATTRFGGLFYLVGRVLEIELAEALWAIGVHEGDVLAYVALAITGGDRSDPAWRWFGGAFDRVPIVPSAPAWAVAEVNAAVQHNLGRRLVRFGITLTPDGLSSTLDRLAGEAPADATMEPLSRHLISRCTAALATITVARLEHPPSWSLLSSVITRPATLIMTGEALRVLLPAAALDIDHRRAGLDHDHTYVPWLGRPVAFEFLGLQMF